MPSTIDSIQIITDNTPSVTDWLMVGITVVYVGATIGIFVANKKSAKAAEKQIQQAKEQLKESERQFEESKRMECIPFLQIELPYDTYPKQQMDFEMPLYRKESTAFSYVNVKVKNLGYGSATNIRFFWEYDGCQKDLFWILPINAIMQGDEYIIQFSFQYDENDLIDKTTFIWEFEDLLGNSYEQRVYFHFNEGDLEFCDNCSPEYIG